MKLVLTFGKWGLLLGVVLCFAGIGIWLNGAAYGALYVVVCSDSNGHWINVGHCRTPRIWMLTGIVLFITGAVALVGRWCIASKRLKQG